MTFLPVVARELRVAARRRGTYWMRLGAAMLVVVLGVWTYLMYHEWLGNQIALPLFGVLGFCALLHCWLSGVRSTADCLSQEKREGTFGLLFLTDLKGYDVVLGKLVASSLNSIYGVLAVVPMMAVPMLIGGVAPAEVCRMALVVLNTLFFSLTLGLCISAMSRSGRNAIMATVLVLVLLTIGLPIVSSLLMEFKRMPTARYLMLPSVGFSYYATFDVCYRTIPREFWWSLAVVHGLAWLCLLLAFAIAPRAWQDRPAVGRAFRWRERQQLWSYGNLAERHAFRRRLLDRNAFFWLAARARLKPALVWATLGVLACGWVWGLAKFRRDWLTAAVYAMTALVLNALLKLWFASEAGRQLAAERQQGSLELMLSTPMSVRDILQGQLLGLLRQFLGPLIAVLAIGVVCLLATLSDTSDPEDRAACRWAYSAAMVMLVLDLAALYATGMWQAMSARNPNRTTRGTIFRILVLPWVGVFLVESVVSFASPRWGQASGWKLFLALWVGFGLLADAWFGGWAWQKLLSEFRLAAEQRYAPRRGFWRRLFTGGEAAPIQSPPVIGAGA